MVTKSVSTEVACLFNYRDTIALRSNFSSHALAFELILTLYVHSLRVA